MTPRLCWWLVDALARLLDEREQEVVRGDLVECGTPPARALYEVAGLVVRRQAAIWLDWRPWLTLAAVVIPIGLLLSHASRWWGVTTARNAFHYWLLWDVDYLWVPGWRADLLGIVANSSMTGLVLVGWAWTSGFVLGRLSRRTVWVLVFMLCVLVFLGTTGTLATGQPQRPTPTLQYHVIFVVAPRLLRTFLVLLPVACGAYRAMRATPLPLLPTIAGVIVLALLTSEVSRGLEGALTFGRGVIPSDPGPDGYVVSDDDPRPLWPLSLLLMWPAAYVLAVTGWEQRRRRNAVA